MDIDENIRDIARLNGRSEPLSDSEVSNIRTEVSNGFIDDQLDKSWSELSETESTE